MNKKIKIREKDHFKLDIQKKIIINIYRHLLLLIKDLLMITMIKRNKNFNSVAIYKFKIYNGLDGIGLKLELALKFILEKVKINQEKKFT